MGLNASKTCGNSLPVDMMTWNDAIVFCNRLSVRDGLKPAYDISGDIPVMLHTNGYRLLTEAEWVYAFQKGEMNLHDTGEIAKYAWFADNTQSSKPVGLKAPCALGLYDMVGNVETWCWDFWGEESDDLYQSAETTTHPHLSTSVEVDDFMSSNIVDPAGAREGIHRLQRGSSFENSAEVCRLSLYSRGGGEADRHTEDTGLRLARWE